MFSLLTTRWCSSSLSRFFRNSYWPLSASDLRLLSYGGFLWVDQADPKPSHTRLWLFFRIWRRRRTHCSTRLQGWKENLKHIELPSGGYFLLTPYLSNGSHRREWWKFKDSYIPKTSKVSNIREGGTANVNFFHLRFALFPLTIVRGIKSERKKLTKWESHFPLKST